MSKSEKARQALEDLVLLGEKLEELALVKPDYFPEYTSLKAYLETLSA